LVVRRNLFIDKSQIYYCEENPPLSSWLSRCRSCCDDWRGCAAWLEKKPPPGAPPLLLLLLLLLPPLLLEPVDLG
jgi:hypothetical protein